ncbi:keratin-like protein KRT222 [Striga asiatica]|uniref:Keratin-like protein KRT222 n=1 Tax=Striga asiatica TaxID=4170 RepID=A0A5A7NXN8_STRAF|nr:keratin-like protein KRT222 [Striga asiatica]
MNVATKTTEIAGRLRPLGVDERDDRYIAAVGEAGSQVESKNWPALRSVLFLRHVCFSPSANCGSRVGSESWAVLKFRRRAEKEEQWAKPRVWPPDRATKSFGERPRLAKLWMSWEVLKNGDGRFTVSFALFVGVESSSTDASHP